VTQPKSVDDLYIDCAFVCIVLFLDLLQHSTVINNNI